MRPVVAALLVPLAACHPDARFEFSDTIDLDFDFGLSRADTLHQPYVEGSSFTIYVDDRREHLDDGVTLDVEDGDVLAVDETGVSNDGEMAWALVDAVGTGRAEVAVVDDRGKVLDSETVEVVRPDDATLLAAAPVFVGRSDFPAETEEAKILLGGTATFQVVWTDHGERLFGNGALDFDIDDPELARVEVRHSWLFEDREWIQITPLQSGSFEVGIVHAPSGHAIRWFAVDVVDETDIAEVTLVGQNERGAEDGDWMVVAAQAWDAAGVPIYGVEYTWDVDGLAQAGEGDLYRYEYDPAQPVLLGAENDAGRAEADIHAGEGYVDSSNNIGCSTVGSGSRMSAFLLVPLAAMLRRRRIRSPV